MRKTLALLATAVFALSLSSGAVAAGKDAGPPYTPDAKMHGCRDKANNLVAKAKCDAPAAATAKPKNCKKGKPCGDSCIAMSDTCHIPAK
jgi:hypothetical protein